MEALEALITRRSTRRFGREMPDRAVIERVIEAGRHAPSGGNSQTTHLFVLCAPAVLSELAELVQAEFARMEEGPNTYASLRNSIRASRRGGYVFHYGAPVLVVAANRRGYGNALADTACALENMMVAANALDLGSCWINQLRWLDESPAVRAYLARYGLEDGETITGGLALGPAEGGLPPRTPLPRTGNPVTWVE